MTYIFMEVEWNEAKSERNLRERGLDFAYAALVFEGPVIEREDAAATTVSPAPSRSGPSGAST